MTLTEQEYYGGGRFADTDVGTVRAHRNARVTVVTNTLLGGVVELPPSRFLQGGTTLTIVNVGTRRITIEDSARAAVTLLNAGWTCEVRLHKNGTPQGKWYARTKLTNTTDKKGGESVMSLLFGGAVDTSLSTKTDKTQRWDGSAWSQQTKVPTLNTCVAATYGSRVFLFPVLDDAKSLPSFQYDPDAWSAIQELPISKVKGCAATAGGAVHLLSGSELIQDQGHEHLVYEPDAYRFAADSLQAGVNSGAGQQGGRVYLLKSNQDVEEYDLAGDAWAQKTASALTKRADVLQTFRSGAGLHWCGGAGPVTVYADSESYDAATDTWSAQPAMPGVKRLFGATSAGADGFVAGGMSGTVPSPGMSGSTFEFSGGAWSSGTAVPTPVAQVNAAAALAAPTGVGGM